MTAPTLSGFAPSVTLAENTVNATPQVIDSSVVFTDPDNDYNGGTLVVSGLLAEDRVSVLSGLVISLSGGVVYYDADGAGGDAAVAIGTATGGVGTAFTVTFNASATAAMIDLLIENLTYANVSNAPTASRALRINVTDAAGGDLGVRAASFTEHTGAANPFNGIDLGLNTAASFADLDGDGDMDAVIGEYGGRLFYFENTGTTSVPVFTQRSGAANPLNGLDVGFWSNPTFADLDADGDLDAVVGEYGGALLYFQNTGTASAPVFVQRTGAANPFNGVDVSFNSTPTFVDMDADGDLDAVVGEYFGSLLYFENTGTASAPVFIQRTGAANPFNGVDAGYRSDPTFADIDGDGDLDAVVGEENGVPLYFENTGTTAAPLFVQRTGVANPFSTVSVIGRNTPALADLDGDGDLDVLTGEVLGRLQYFENIPVSGQPITVTVTAQNDASTATGLPSDVTVTADVGSDLNLSAITLADADTTGAITVVLTASAGTMTAASRDGVNVSNSGTGAITLTGTVSAIDTFLNTASAVQYTGATNASGDNAATLTITADDGAGAVTLGVVNIDINDAPTLTGLASSVTVNENTVNRTPQLLDSNVTVADAEGNFNGGTLTVTGLLAEDRVSIASGAVVSLSGGTVYYDADGAGAGSPVAIGTATGGSGSAFTVTFNGAATTAMIEAVIETLTYGNVSDTPTASRTLRINVTDAAGADMLSPVVFSQQDGSNPFSGVSFGSRAAATFGDLDGDGDLDAIVGVPFDGLQYFKNTGTAQAPVFVQQSGVDVPFGNISGDQALAPVLVDLDADGDLDLVVGVNDGTIRYQENTGTAGAAVFTERSGAANPFAAIDESWRNSPSFGDVDGDGDLDLVIGEAYGEILNYFENTGAAGAPVFVQRTGAANPFNGLNVGGNSNPFLVDIDGDGDLDAVVGQSNGSLTFLENTGSAAAPTYVARSGAANPFDGVTVGSETMPTFADLDGDGDLDALIGNYYSYYGGPAQLWFFRNQTGTNPSITVTVTPEAEVDPIIGGGTADSLTGTGAADTIDGGAGDDVLDGGAGDDILIGGIGSDRLKGGAGADAMSGGTGDDTYVVDNAGDTTNEAGGDGVDLVWSAVSWTLGAGFENATLAAPGGAINATGNSLDNLLLGNSFANVLSGLDGNDTLIGDGGADTLNGGDGADSLDGGGQNDTLNGGAGIDTLAGGIGNDALDGGTGADAMTGGAGNDSYVVDDAGDTVTELAGGGTDSVSASVAWTLTDNVESLTLTGSGDIAGTGNALRNTITGNSGANVLHGGGEIDTLNGGDGADTLYGDAGGDVLSGQNGDDFLYGGAGEDSLTGGAGADTFAFSALDMRRSSLGQAAEKDKILDLSFAANDRIDLSAIDANTGLDGDQAFSFVSKFTKLAGQAVMTLSGGITTLQLDVDGDGKADLMIAITGNVTATTANLYTGGGDVNGGWVL